MKFDRKSVSNFIRSVVIFIILFTSFIDKIAAQQGPALPPKFVDGILAVVGEKIILASDFETEKVQIARGQTLPDSQKIYCYVLEQLIIRKLMLSQAEIDSLPLPDDRIEAEIDNRIRNFQRQAGSLSDLEKYLGKTIQEFKEEIRPKMREQLLAQEMQQKITGTIRISPKEIQEYYKKIPEDSLPIIPTEVEVAQLLVELPISQISTDFAIEQLEQLKKRIQKGESFEKLARLYSMDPGSKNQGGLLPEFGRGEMVSQFERMAFKLKEDSLSPVFKSDFGYHLMKLIKRKGERVIAAHILIRPENTSDDYLIASNRVDSIHNLLVSGSVDWCTAVKKYSSEKMGNQGYCGFLTDEATGMQKTLFEALPTDVKQIIDKMKPGEFSKPAVTQTPDGRIMYRILYLKTFIPPHQANLIQDYSRIQMEAESEKKQQAIDKWVEKHRKRTYIKIYARDAECIDLEKWENE
jgi:peptidyl-prolyl cis-trans isomerase SurA